MKAHAIARLEQGRLLALQIPHLLLGDADDLPATGAGLRINTTETAGQGYGSGRNAGTRGAAPRHDEFGAAAEVGKAWGEAAEGDVVIAAGMAAYYLLDADIQRPRHLFEVFAIVVHGNLDQLAGRARLAVQLARGNSCGQRLAAEGQGASARAACALPE